MNSTKKELEHALELVKKVKILVIGDLILDRYVWGKVNRISPEAPVPVVEVKKTEDRLGGAGNVASNLRSIGASVTMIGYVGDDLEGERITELLQQEGSSSKGIVIDTTKPTSVKTRIVAHHQQVCRVDREDTSVRSEEITQRLLAKVQQELPHCDAVILSDYGKGTVSKLLIEALEQQKVAGMLSLQKRPLVIDPHPANYGSYLSMSVAKPNRREAELATGLSIIDRSSAISAAEALLTLWNSDIMMITLGEDGMVLAFADGQPPILLSTRAKAVFDVSGAGDTVTALFTAAIAAGITPRIAGDLANIGAGIVVSIVGTVPVDNKRLHAEIGEITA